MKKLLIVLPIMFFVACSASKDITNINAKLFYETPKDWEDEESRREVIAKYTEYLAGHKFYIDPGHGGADRRNSSYDSLLVEADLNLNVALGLRDYLEQAGAIVYMTREKDITVDLKERSRMANESDAEFFISIHHNAPGEKGNNWTNYTSTYYHAAEDDYEYEPFDRDMARYVQRDLAYVMRNPGGLGSFDGTYSDYKIYPGDGFSVLRETEIPAILVECAFFTSRFEKFRLVEKEFNLIQAWGIFRGLGKFFQAGFPEIKLLKENCSLSDNNLHLELLLSDESGIRANSIEVFFDSVRVDHHFNENNNIVTVDLQNIPSGEHELRVICQNKNGNHALPYYSQIITQ